MNTQPDSNPINIRRTGLAGLFVIVVFFGGVGIWSAFAPLHGAVVTQGLVKVENHRQTIQHNEGGIIKQILVKDGSVVRKGDPLLILGDAATLANYQSLRNALDTELARQVRLAAESRAAVALDFPAEIQSKQAIAREKALYAANRASLDTQGRLLRQQISQVRKEIEALQKQHDAEHNARSLSEEELRAYEQLQNQQYISGARVLSQKRMVADYQSRAEERRAEIARAAQREAELQLRLANLQNDRVRDAAEELRGVTARIAELREKLLPAEDTLKRQSITAPVSGSVISLRIHTPGSAIGPREPILEIVPSESNLLVEARVGVDAIKELRPGQMADLRFTALPQRTTPLVNARIAEISADAISEPQSAPYYLLRLVPDAASLKQSGIDHLQPGMMAEVYIRTRSRTAIEYFLQPITDSLARALRER